MGNAGRAFAGVVAVGGVALGAVAMVPKTADLLESRHREAATYATGSAAKAARESVPGWLPDDATKVSYLMSTTGDDRLLKASLPDRKLPEGCSKGTPQGAVHLKASWFPGDIPAKATARCGYYNVALVGNELYGWQDNAVVIAARKAGGTAG
ncbi:hypothetical protein [Saccharothrix sp. ST-888]|uniref:hypothetical protein n=1 Tax=Saccharothrix sp. ST-888 TaxID=1427391 RepID=UPI0005EC893D|nr:hypothetical protein [Saccharothrix sp. ST-888]KJK60071.1 hypothetical protein UK12_01235 [Saccharothrix sp. ST-888]